MIQQVSPGVSDVLHILGFGLTVSAGVEILVIVNGGFVIGKALAKVHRIATLGDKISFEYKGFAVVGFAFECVFGFHTIKRQQIFRVAKPDGGVEIANVGTVVF